MNHRLWLLVENEQKRLIKLIEQEEILRKEVERREKIARRKRELKAELLENLRSHFQSNYCDDIIVVMPPGREKEVEEFIEQAISDVHLMINQKKTSRASFPSDPTFPAERNGTIQYLGFDFNGVQRLIRASSLSRYYSKMRNGVSLAKQTQRKYNRIETGLGHKPSSLKTRQLYIRYTYLIRRRYHSKIRGEKFRNENFITYAFRAAREMNAPEIKHQVRGHFKKLKAEISKPV